jgi:hypothetical protein
MIPFLEPFAHHYTPAWRTSDAALDCIQAVLEKYKPRSILELGPGLSSFLFYKYAEENPTVMYQVFDHKDTFAYKHSTRVKEAGFDPSNITILPLTAGHDYNFGKNYIPSTDLIFVDGPPDSEARLRLERIFVHPRFDCCLWLIDDTHRWPEAELARLLTRPTHTAHLIRDLIFTPRTSTLLVPRSGG